jgi:hypothetical protein
MTRWRPPTPEEEAAWYRRLDEGIAEHGLKFTRPAPPPRKTVEEARHVSNASRQWSRSCRTMKSPRCSFVVLAALVLSACASKPPLPAANSPSTDLAAIKAEREASSKVYVLCLMQAAKRLDDRKSDPGTIAEAMLSACAMEARQNVKVHSRYLEAGLAGEEKVARSLREASFGSAIEMVLENRKAAQARLAG